MNLSRHFDNIIDIIKNADTNLFYLEGFEKNYTFFLINGFKTFWRVQ